MKTVLPKLHEPQSNEAISGLSETGSMRCSSVVWPAPPPVDMLMITSEPAARIRSRTLPYRAGSQVTFPCSLRTCRWTIAAPALCAARAASAISSSVIGTAGLSVLVGQEPVRAAEMMTGWLRSVGVIDTRRSSCGVRIRMRESSTAAGESGPGTTNEAGPFRTRLCHGSCVPGSSQCRSPGTLPVVASTLTSWSPTSTLKTRWPW